MSEEPETPADACDVSIVMPCLDEKLTLEKCIGTARECLDVLEREDGLTGEIVISDNGSTDGSQDIARRNGARVVDCPTRGYGNAIRYGVRRARGRYVVMGDSDASYDFREAVGMIRKLAEGHEVCMGTRLRGTIMPGAMPWKNRWIGNPVLTGILNLLFRSGLSDAHCGLRAFTREGFERINPTSDGMEFASEIVIKAALLDLERTEVPITLHPDGRDRPPHLRPWRDGWRHLRYLVMLSPLWLYFIPSFLMVTLGVSLFGILLSGTGGEMVRVGSFRFGDHWSVIAGTALSMGHQTFLLGMTATLYGVRQGYRGTGRALRFLYRLAQLEVMIILGLLLLAAGIAVLAWVTAIWRSGDFESFRRIREMAIGTSLMAIGLQNVFGGFLLSVVGGNAADLHELTAGTAVARDDAR